VGHKGKGSGAFYFHPKRSPHRMVETGVPETGSYARAGVDRASVSRSLARLLAEVRYRPAPSSGRRVGAPGHYAGMVRIGAETIAVTTDTVGTKVLLAEELARWEEVGEDVVAVNVNDLAAVGARPSGFVDCISLARPDEAIFAELGRGIERGLRAARCHLLGGETAMVPELVHSVDLGGTAFGFFPRGRRPVLGSEIRPGDVIIGIPSSGLHANGLTLARRIVRDANLPLDAPRPGGDRPLGHELLTPTRIYVAVTEALAGLPEVTGFSHLSGGGIRNLVRLHPRVRFVLDRWPAPPPIFGFIQEHGAVPPTEMYQTFNMGIGFVVIARPRRHSELFRRLARAGAPDSRVIGTVTRGRGVALPALGLDYVEYG
jgi:phosphoribosylformylglycinamidine cyclo-ligase